MPTTTVTVTVPVANPAGPAEVAAATATHNWHEQAQRCIECACRADSAAATWPCGTVVPTETVTVDAPYYDGDEEF